MILNEYEDTLLHGDDKTQRVVAVENIPGKDELVVMYIRREDGTIYQKHTNMKWIVYIRSDDPIIDQLQGMEYDDLFGSNFYNIRVYCKSKKQAQWVKNNAINSLMVLPSAQFYVQSGVTLFKGMKFDDVLRAYVDIEVLTAEGYEFPNSLRPEDKICVISIHYNHSHQSKLIVLNDDGLSTPADNRILCSTERELLEAFVREIRTTDPSVLILHNGFKFDFPYIRDRCTVNNVKLALGRNGSEPYFFSTSIKFADKADDFENCVIYGRHVMDTFFLAKQYDVIKRELPGYGLKEIVKYLGKASDDRTYIDGSKLTWHWFNERDKLLAYAMDDVIETEIVAQLVGQTSFYSTQMFPLPYQDVSRYGTGTLIDNWLIRDYYRDLWSLPTPDPKLEFEGAYTDTYIFGVTKGRLVYTDVASLYPTIRDVFHIKPPKDELDVYDTKMRLLKRIRLEYKAESKRLYKVSDENKKLAKPYKDILDTADELDGRQSVTKILLNTGGYGYLSWEYGTFNYYKGGAMITEWGQKIIRLMVDFVNSKAPNLVVRLDTDGSLNILPPCYTQDEKGELEFISDMNEYVNEKFDILYEEWKLTQGK